jgi:hypothetical protein
VVLLIHVVFFAALNWRKAHSKLTATRSTTVWLLPEVVPLEQIVLPTSRDIKTATHVAPTNRAVINTTEPQIHVETPVDSSTPEVHLDLDALRADAVAAEINRKKSPIELANEAQLKDHSFETQVEGATNKSQRPDCRTEYSGAGLLAVLPIAVDLIRGKGCKF